MRPAQPQRIDALVVKESPSEVSTGQYIMPGEYGIITIFEVSRLDGRTSVVYKSYDGTTNKRTISSDGSCREIVLSRLVFP